MDSKFSKSAKRNQVLNPLLTNDFRKCDDLKNYCIQDKSAGLPMEEMMWDHSSCSYYDYDLQFSQTQSTNGRNGPTFYASSKSRESFYSANGEFTVTDDVGRVRVLTSDDGIGNGDDDDDSWWYSDAKAPESKYDEWYLKYLQYMKPEKSRSRRYKGLFNPTWNPTHDTIDEHDPAESLEVDIIENELGQNEKFNNEGCEAELAEAEAEPDSQTEYISEWEFETPSIVSSLNSPKENADNVENDDRSEDDATSIQFYQLDFLQSDEIERQELTEFEENEANVEREFRIQSENDEGVEINQDEFELEEELELQSGENEEDEDPTVFDFTNMGLDNNWEVVSIMPPANINKYGWYPSVEGLWEQANYDQTYDPLTDEEEEFVTKRPIFTREIPQEDFIQHQSVPKTVNPDNPINHHAHGSYGPFSCEFGTPPQPQTSLDSTSAPTILPSQFEDNANPVQKKFHNNDKLSSCSNSSRQYSIQTEMMKFELKELSNSCSASPFYDLPWVSSQSHPIFSGSSSQEWVTNIDQNSATERHHHHCSCSCSTNVVDKNDSVPIVVLRPPPRSPLRRSSSAQFIESASKSKMSPGCPDLMKLAGEEVIDKKHNHAGAMNSRQIYSNSIQDMQTSSTFENCNCTLNPQKMSKYDRDNLQVISLPSTQPMKEKLTKKNTDKDKIESPRKLNKSEKSQIPRTTCNCETGNKNSPRRNCVLMNIKGKEKVKSENKQQSQALLKPQEEEIEERKEFVEYVRQQKSRTRTIKLRPKPHSCNLDKDYENSDMTSSSAREPAGETNCKDCSSSSPQSPRAASKIPVSPRHAKNNATKLTGSYKNLHKKKQNFTTKTDQPNSTTTSPTPKLISGPQAINNLSNIPDCLEEILRKPAATRIPTPVTRRERYSISIPTSALGPTARQDSSHLYS